MARGWAQVGTIGARKGPCPSSCLAKEGTGQQQALRQVGSILLPTRWPRSYSLTMAILAVTSLLRPPFSSSLMWLRAAQGSLIQVSDTEAEFKGNRAEIIA